MSGFNERSVCEICLEGAAEPMGATAGQVARE